MRTAEHIKKWNIQGYNTGTLSILFYFYNETHSGSVSESLFISTPCLEGCCLFSISCLMSLSYGSRPVNCILFASNEDGKSN